MYRRKVVVVALHSAMSKYVGLFLLETWRDRDDGVVHEVTDLVDTLVNAFAFQASDGVRRGGEEVGRYVVRNDAVDLLRHRAFLTAHPRLDMRDRDLQLRRGERACQRRICVA